MTLMCRYSRRRRLIVTGQPRLGYDLGTVTSLALTGAVGPRALNAGDPYSVSLASLGGISALANLLKSYQMRTGKPDEVEFNTSNRS